MFLTSYLLSARKVHSVMEGKLCTSKDVQGDRGIDRVSSSGHFINRKPGNAVYKDIVFIAPENLYFF